jgi:hypothetical protein
MRLSSNLISERPAQGRPKVLPLGFTLRWLTCQQRLRAFKNQVIVNTTLVKKQWGAPRSGLRQYSKFKMTGDFRNMKAALRFKLRLCEGNNLRKTTNVTNPLQTTTLIAELS